MTQDDRTRRFVLHAYHRAKARHQIRELGHPLPDPTDPDDLWRTRFEDLIYRNITGTNPARHLRDLDGGSEGSVVGRRPGPEDAASAVVGDRPPRVPSAESEGHPTNLTGEGQGGPGLAAEYAGSSPPAPTTSTEGES